MSSNSGITFSGITSLLNKQTCELGAKAATRALVTGYTACETVRLVNVLKLGEIFPKTFSGLNSRYVEIASILAGVSAGLYAAYRSYCNESAAASAKAAGKDPVETKSFQVRWLEAKGELKSAVRCAAVAFFAPALFEAIQPQINQVPMLNRLFKTLMTNSPWGQSAVNAISGLGAIPAAALTFSTCVATRVIGPFSVNEERSAKETTYQQKYDFARVLWEAPLVMAMTHLTLNALNMPVSNSLRDSIKYTAIMATLADSLFAGISQK